MISDAVRTYVAVSELARGSFVAMPTVIIIREASFVASLPYDASWLLTTPHDELTQLVGV
jgi:hypothetical protein